MNKQIDTIKYVTHLYCASVQVQILWSLPLGNLEDLKLTGMFVAMLVTL